MSRILFDQNVPAPLRQHLGKHEIHIADEEGWGELSNGDLIRSAERAGFQILMTCDQNVRYQQNLAVRNISMIVLGSNIWPDVKPMVAQIADAVERTMPGSFQFVEIKPQPRPRRVRGRQLF